MMSSSQKPNPCKSPTHKICMTKDPAAICCHHFCTSSNLRLLSTHFRLSTMSTMLAKVAARSVASGARQMGNRSASSITAVKGREVIDSRGNPTMEVKDYFVDSFFYFSLRMLCTIKYVHIQKYSNVSTCSSSVLATASSIVSCHISAVCFLKRSIGSFFQM